MYCVLKIKNFDDGLKIAVIGTYSTVDEANNQIQNLKALDADVARRMDKAVKLISSIQDIIINRNEIYLSHDDKVKYVSALEIFYYYVDIDLLSIEVSRDHFNVNYKGFLPNFEESLINLRDLDIPVEYRWIQYSGYPVDNSYSI